MKIRLSGDIQTDSIVDGEGIRTVIWTQGCSHNCEGCHNPKTHSFDDGILMDVDELLKQIDSLEYQDGITLSGGDPFFQVKPCILIAKRAKKNGLNVWAYTGFTFDELIKMKESNEDLNELLKYIDVIVDGKFDINKKSLNCKFRGSTNQRIIDVQKSLKDNKVILVEKYKG